MILYHAGPAWARTFEVEMPQSDLANRLCSDHGFLRGMLFQPFGMNRGAVIATREHMLVMALGTDTGATWFSVAPAKEIQDLLWSFSNGYASQWSARELKALSGCEDWQALQLAVRGQFAAAVRSVERAIAGKPEHDPRPISEMPDDDVFELPSDYLQAMPMEDAPCVH